MPEHDKFEKLKSFYRQLLPAMTEDSWKICESTLSVRNIKKGEMLVREGMICNHVSFINHGLVKIYYVVGGKEKIINFCNELNYVSDYHSFLVQAPAQTFVTAIEDTEVIDTSYSGLQMLYERVPEANILGRMIAERLFIQMCESTSCEVKDSIEERYRKVMQEKPWLVQRAPQYMIASYLGITPEALSRVKARMSPKRKPVLAAIY
jgi:CRP-like cAMP-binding protein